MNSKKRLIAPILLGLLAVFLVSIPKVFAATDSVSVLEIDYERDTITIQANAGDTKVFFSNKDASTWEEIYGTLDASRRITMDISWISKTSPYVISFKGDKSTKPIKVKLPKQNTNFKVSLNTLDNTVNFSNLGACRYVHWRKNNSTVWKSIDTYGDMTDFKNELERFSVQGATLYFRTEQIKGNILDVGVRPSKECVIKITKRAAAPSAVLNLTAETIAVKSTMEYRRSEETEWKEITGTQLKLSEVAPEAFNKGGEVSIDIRTRATKTKMASQIQTLVIPEQEATPDPDHTISIEYLGSKQGQFKIEKYGEGDDKILAPSTTNVYEYTIIKPDETYKQEEAKWTSITSSAPIKFTSEQAPEGSQLYIRKKATDKKLATKPVIYKIGTYPSISSVKEPAKFSKIEGMEASFVFYLVVPRSDTKVSSIQFEGASVGYKASDAMKAEDSENYMITVTINDTSSVETLSDSKNKELKGIITLSNGDKIENGVTLYINPKAYSTDDTSVRKYIGVEYEKDVDVVICVGDKDKKEIKATKVTIADIEVPFTQTETDSYQEKTITIKGNDLNEVENKIKKSLYGSEQPVIIEFDNGETVKTKTTVVVKNAAEVTSDESGFGISASTYQKLLEEKKKAEEAEKNNSDDDKNNDKEDTTTVEVIENPIITLTIDENLYTDDKSIYVSSVTWQGKNIIRTFTTKNNITTITLDVDKIVNAADMESGKKNYSGPVIVTLNKGDGKEVFVTITSNYKITVVE